MARYELFYLMDSFGLDNPKENYVENYTFWSVENSNFWSQENLSISSGNKSETVLTEYSISKIPSGINS